MGIVNPGSFISRINGAFDTKTYCENGDKPPLKARTEASVGKNSDPERKDGEKFPKTFAK